MGVTLTEGGDVSLTEAAPASTETAMLFEELHRHRGSGSPAPSARGAPRA